MSATDHDTSLSTHHRTVSADDMFYSIFRLMAFGIPLLLHNGSFTIHLDVSCSHGPLTWRGAHTRALVAPLRSSRFADVSLSSSSQMHFRHTSCGSNVREIAIMPTNLSQRSCHGLMHTAYRCPWYSLACRCEERLDTSETSLTAGCFSVTTWRGMLSDTHKAMSDWYRDHHLDLAMICRSQSSSTKHFELIDSMVGYIASIKESHFAANRT